MADERTAETPDESLDSTAPDDLPETPPEAPPSSAPGDDLETLDEEVSEADRLPTGASGRSVAGVACPWCGEHQDLFLEPARSGGEQRYLEECRSCGRDIAVVYETNDAGAPRVSVDRPQ